MKKPECRIIYARNHHILQQNTTNKHFMKKVNYYDVLNVKLKLTASVHLNLKMFLTCDMFNFSLQIFYLTEVYFVYLKIVVEKHSLKAKI